MPRRAGRPFRETGASWSTETNPAASSIMKIAEPSKPAIGLRKTTTNRPRGFSWTGAQSILDVKSLAEETGALSASFGAACFIGSPRRSREFYQRARPPRRGMARRKAQNPYGSCLAARGRLAARHMRSCRPGAGSASKMRSSRPKAGSASKCAQIGQRPVAHAICGRLFGAGLALVRSVAHQSPTEPSASSWQGLVVVPGGAPLPPECLVATRPAGAAPHPAIKDASRARPLVGRGEAMIMQSEDGDNSWHIFQGALMEAPQERFAVRRALAGCSMLCSIDHPSPRLLVDVLLPQFVFTRNVERVPTSGKPDFRLFPAPELTGRENDRARRHISLLFGRPRQMVRSPKNRVRLLYRRDSPF